MSVTGSLRGTLPNADRAGIVASMACAVHCLIAPLLFLLVPSVAGVWAHPAAHAVIAVLVLPLAGTVMVRSVRMHRRRWVFVTSVLGVAAVLASCVLPWLAPDGAAQAAGGASCGGCCPRIAEDVEGAKSMAFPIASQAAVAGSVLLIASHVGNLVYCRRWRTRECGHCSTRVGSLDS